MDFLRGKFFRWARASTLFLLLAASGDLSRSCWYLEDHAQGHGHDTLATAVLYELINGMDHNTVSHSRLLRYGYDNSVCISEVNRDHGCDNKVSQNKHIKQKWT